MTTIISVRRDGKVAIGGDGQATLGNTVMKANVRKVRSLHDGKVLAGFAGGTADAFTMFERFESKMKEHNRLMKAAVEMAKDWRSDKYLRKLEALLVVADAESSFIISGNGDVIETEDDLLAIGSGGSYAQAAAKALLRNTELGASEIVTKSLEIAADIDIYSNQTRIVEELDSNT